MEYEISVSKLILSDIQQQFTQSQITMFHAITNDIQVSVLPVYIDENSDPDRSHYFWAYRIQIENKGSETVQLVSRHWEITDAKGKTEIVDGAGVVGEQPILQPGEMYEYTSGCPLGTSSGFMQGTYQMVNEEQVSFDVTIPAFPLDLPDSEPVYN